MMRRNRISQAVFHQIVYLQKSIVNSFLYTLREVLHSKRESAIVSVIAVGTFSVMRLNTTNPRPLSADSHESPSDEVDLSDSTHMLSLAESVEYQNNW